MGNTKIKDNFLPTGIWEQVYNKSHYNRAITKEGIELVTKAIKEYLKDKPLSNKEEKVTIPRYVSMTKEEIDNLADGDICYIMSSWGMQETTYPALDGDTHRNLFGKGGANKTLQERIDFGPIYKLNPEYGK